MFIEDLIYRYLGIYKSLPDTVKRVLAFFYRKLPVSIRYGKTYKQHTTLLKASKNWTKNEIAEFQLGTINGLLQAAKKNVPYYSSTLKNITLPLQSLEKFRDKIPFINKDIVRSAPDMFLVSGQNRKKLISLTTGGTTGEPLRLYYEKGVTRTKERVYILDMMSRVGYRPDDTMAVFRSALIRGRTNKKLWEYDPVKNRYFFSMYDLTEKNMMRYFDKLQEIKPRFLHVYPSALTIFAHFMRAKKLPPIDSIAGILSGSENTFPHQIRLFREVFGCKLLRWYGLGEMSALGGSCESSYDYHCYPTYSYTELIDHEGRPVTEIGQKGEIVGTTFDNISMPLIRYRTGDYAIYGGEQCPSCGRIGLLLKEVEGRVQEYIIDKGGNKFSLGPFIFGIHEKFWGNISSLQFEQKEKGKLVIYATSGTLAPTEIKTYLHRVFSPRFAGNFEINIKAVKSIERGPGGKHKYLKQELKIAE